MEHTDRARFPRKLAAILYADVVGYSRLTGRDEDATPERLGRDLDHLADTVGRHSGQVVHYAGDAVLARFEAAIDALECAVEVQREFSERNRATPDERKLLFRMGINIGDVIVDRDDIYGDGVNVAARLEGLARPGGICVSESVRVAVGNKLPVGYEPMGEQVVKNIAESVKTCRVRFDDAARVGRVARATRMLERRWPILAGGLALLGALALTGRIYQDSSGAAHGDSILALPKGPSIAALPFSNLNEDAGQDYFADGITEDIITRLSLFRELKVIARNSTFRYKGRPVDVRSVSRELNARCVLEGSVRKDVDTIRVTAQLVDGPSGAHL